MLNYFCSNCGGKNPYQLHKPKFCLYCSLPFLTAQSNESEGREYNTGRAIVTRGKHNYNLDTDDDSSYSKNDFECHYSSMKGFDLSINNSNSSSGVSLSSLISTSGEKTIAPKKNKRHKGRKRIAKELPESFVSEAKNMGRNYKSDIIIDDLK